MGAGEYREPNDARVLLNRGADNLFGSLMKSGVDDFEASITKRSSNHLRTSVVTIEPWFGDDDANSRPGSLVVARGFWLTYEFWSVHVVVPDLHRCIIELLALATQYLSVDPVPVCRWHEVRWSKSIR